MPELPEVETIVRQLKKNILGKVIQEVKIVDTTVVDAAVKNVLNARITNVERRGKNIIIELNKDKALLIHLRMTGHFHYVQADNRSNDYTKYLALKLGFADGSILTHNAIRRFERVSLLSRKQLKEKLSLLGPEPLSSAFTARQFKERILQYPHAIIKNKLLDQSFVAGIGNIYAQEALYHARIDPQRAVKSLTETEMTALYHELRAVLSTAIKHNGTTVENYQNLDGKGNFQNFLAVYQREQCPQQHPVEKISLGGRGTYYCPRCQQ